MSVKGGITTSDNEVEMTIQIAGGKSYKKVYNDVVSLAIDKFVLISSFLSKMLSTQTPVDTKFYVAQAKQLLRRGHVELLQGDLPFHNKYNMWLLDGYIRMLLETSDIKLVSQLLDLDSILYSIEQEDEHCCEIEFIIPSTIKVIKSKNIDPSGQIHSPKNDEIGSYIRSFNHNMGVLVKFVMTNKSALDAVYKSIIQQAKKRLV